MIPQQVDKVKFGDSIEVDIHPQIDWNAGEFGDQYSCLWNGNTRQKDWFNAQPDFRALRVYQYGRGVGRALLLKDNWNAERWVLFNTFPMENTSAYLDTHGMLCKFLLLEIGVKVEQYRVHIFTGWEKPPWLYTNLPYGIAIQSPKVRRTSIVSLFHNAQGED